MKLAFFITIGLILAASNEALACGCELPVPNRSLRQQVKRAEKVSDAVFTGTVLEITDNKFSVIVKLKVLSRWKGVRDLEVVIFTGRGRGDCGYPFKVGESYLVYAQKLDDETLVTNICKRTDLLAEAQVDIKILGKARRE